MLVSVMTSTGSSPIQRQHFDAGADPCAKRLLQLLLTQDGSTTRLCESIAGGPVQLHVLQQRVTHEVPTVVLTALRGNEFIERCTFLAAHGQVMMDNLSYIALESVPPHLRRDLEDGVMPIGHLLARMWVRRSFLAAAPMMYERLWTVVGLPDPDASRAYCIATPEGPRMLIAETYRRGMLMERDGPVDA